METTLPATDRLLRSIRLLTADPSHGLRQRISSAFGDQLDTARAKFPTALAKGFASAKSQTIGIACRPKCCGIIASGLDATRR